MNAFGIGLFIVSMVILFEANRYMKRATGAYDRATSVQKRANLALEAARDYYDRGDAMFRRSNDMNRATIQLLARPEDGISETDAVH